MAAENNTSPSEQTIFDMARIFATTSDLDLLLSHISTAVEKLTESEAASILLLDDDRKRLVFRVATGQKGKSVKKMYVPVGKGIAGWVAENNKPVVVNDVQSDNRFTNIVDKSSGFSTRSILAVPMMVNGELMGVCEALNKNGKMYTTRDQEVLESLAALAGASIKNARMADDQRNFFSHMIEIITTAVDQGDSRQAGHSFRVAELACRIGRQMGFGGDAYKKLYYAAILHDIGMIATHDLKYLPKILSQTMERTPEKLHPLVGAELVKNIRLLDGVSPIVRHHHEYVDGSGHPDGLVGDDIPVESRIICLVEHLDGLHMRGLVGEEYEKEAIKLSKEGSGSKFDPDVVSAFLSTCKV